MINAMKKTVMGINCQVGYWNKRWNVERSQMCKRSAKSSCRILDMRNYGMSIQLR